VRAFIECMAQFATILLAYMAVLNNKSKGVRAESYNTAYRNAYDLLIAFGDGTSRPVVKHSLRDDVPAPWSNSHAYAAADVPVATDTNGTDALLDADGDDAEDADDAEEIQALMQLDDAAGTFAPNTSPRQHKSHVLNRAHARTYTRTHIYTL